MIFKFDIKKTLQLIQLINKKRMLNTSKQDFIKIASKNIIAIKNVFLD